MKEGKTPRYEKTGGGKTDKKQPFKIHWIGAVSSGTLEEATPPSAEVVNLRRNIGSSASGRVLDNVEVRFSSKRMVDYIRDRLGRGSEIFFGSRHSGGLITTYSLVEDSNRQIVDLKLVLVVEATGEKWSAGMLMEAMRKMLGPIDKDMRDDEKKIRLSAKAKGLDQGSRAVESTTRGRSPKLAERNPKRPERELPREARRKVRREPRDRRDWSPERAAARGEDLEPDPEEVEESDSQYESSEEEAPAPGLRSAPKASARKGPSSGAATKQPAADPKKSGKKEILLNATYQKTQEVILGDEETKAMVEKTCYARAASTSSMRTA